MHILRNGIKADFVERGVFMGVSVMVIALALMAEGVTERDPNLFDTFEGMPAPVEWDEDLCGRPSLRDWADRKLSDVSSNWVNAPQKEVSKAMA